MARLWSCGFELQSPTSLVEVQNLYGVGINTTTVHGGAASYQTGGSIPTTGASGFDHQFSAGSTAVFARYYFYISALDNSVDVVYYCDLLSSGTSVISCQINNVGGSYSITPYYNNFGGSLAPVSLPGITGGWHYLEIRYDSTPANGSEILQVQLDGVQIASSTALNYTIKTVNTVSTGIYNGTVGTITGSTVYVDDIAVNDTSGTAQNSYPGDGKIVHMHPDGAGDNAAWTAGVGGTNNWDRVDETTPDDATTYNQKTTTGTVIDDHTVQSSSSAGISSGDTIKLVEVGLRGGSTATTAGATIAPRLKSAIGGTVSTGTAGAFNVNGWRTNGAATPLPLLISYLDPTTGVAWTPTGTNSLDNMQIGYTNSASNTTVRRVTAVYALVEYLPAASLTVTPPTLALTLTTYAPVIKHQINTGLATLMLSTFAPSVTIGTLVIPSTKALTLTTFAPVVTATANQVVTPSTLALTLTTLAPVIKLAVIPPTTALTLTTFAPVVTATVLQLVVPPTAALILTTFAPRATVGTTVTPGTASLTLATYAPYPIVARKPPTAYSRVVKPPTSYGAAAKLQTLYSRVTKPLTSYTGNTALSDAVTLDSMTVTLDTLLVYLNGYLTSVAPDVVVRPRTQYDPVVKPPTAYS